MTDEPSPLAAMTLAWSNIYASPHHSVWGRSCLSGWQAWVCHWICGLGEQRPDDVFFFVFGLEARREFDLGELREWRRVALPVAAGPPGPPARPEAGQPTGPRSPAGTGQRHAAAGKCRDHRAQHGQGQSGLNTGHDADLTQIDPQVVAERASRRTATSLPGTGASMPAAPTMNRHSSQMRHLGGAIPDEAVVPGRRDWAGRPALACSRRAVPCRSPGPALLGKVQ
jgi:hypothetical protein